MSLHDLTPTEREVLRHYVDAGTNALIARRMGISEQTVKNHVTRILAKMGARSMGQAAVLFDRWERVQPGAAPRERRGGERRSGRDRRAAS